MIRNLWGKFYLFPLIKIAPVCYFDFHADSAVKHPPAMQEPQETWVQCQGQEDPLEEDMATTPVLLPGESHGQRSPSGYSPWGRKESGMTEAT